MYTFSTQIEVPVGSTLAGFADILSPTLRSAQLELHGIGGTTPSAWEVCSIDALYAGVLATTDFAVQCRRVVVASHTHYAPMLDSLKPRLGVYSEETAQRFMRAVESVPKKVVKPDRCSVFRTEVAIPVYRRFDFPGTLIDRLLTRYGGLYPNEEHPIDRGVYVFVFYQADKAIFTLVYHACHPVTRHDGSTASADYVHALREGVVHRFGTPHCLFLLGCAGDVRPNFAEKRVSWLPRTRLNWRFRSPPTLRDQSVADHMYREAAANLTLIRSFFLSESAFSISLRNVDISGAGCVEVTLLSIDDQLVFSFWPFEMSHRYHLETLGGEGFPREFIVSCAGDTLGYLPHPDQIPYGGYEVDGSRPYMGLPSRLQTSGHPW